MDKGRLFTYFLGFLSMVFWGMSFIWSKVCFEYISPMATIFLRLVLSSMVLFSYLVITGKTGRIDRKDRGLFLAAAFFSPFLYFLGENYGLSLVTPTTAAIIIATIPLITPVAATLLLSERLSLLNIVGIIISFSGVMAMIITPDLSLGASPLGVGLLFLAVASATAYALLIRNLTLRYPPIHIMAWQNLLGVIMFLPFFLALDLPRLDRGFMHPELFWSLLQLAVFASSLAFVFFIRLIREVGVSKASVMSNLIPVITALAAYWMWGEQFTLLKIIGITTVIGGVVLTQIPRLHKAKTVLSEACEISDELK